MRALLLALTFLLTSAISLSADQKILRVHTIDNCHWCTKLKDVTLTDPKVKAALSGYKIEFIKGGGQPGYPAFAVGDRWHVGYLAPNDFLRWLSRAK